MERSSKEVQKHFKQAIHNYKFYCEVHKKLPGVFFDWKITVLFYTSVHLLRALLTERDVSLSNSHEALKIHLNPNDNRSKSPVKPFCYHSYIVLYNASLETRYNGYFQGEKQNEYLVSRFKKCEEAIQNIDSYMVSQGYPSILTDQIQIEFEK